MDSEVPCVCIAMIDQSRMFRNGRNSSAFHSRISFNGLLKIVLAFIIIIGNAYSIWVLNRTLKLIIMLIRRCRIRCWYDGCLHEEGSSRFKKLSYFATMLCASKQIICSIMHPLVSVKFCTCWDGESSSKDPTMTNNTQVNDFYRRFHNARLLLFHVSIHGQIYWEIDPLVIP